MLYRLILLGFFSFLGYLFGIKSGQPLEGTALGIALGGLAIILESLLSKARIGSLIGGIIGLGLGIIAARLLYYPFKLIPGFEESYIPVILGTILGYSGFVLGIKKGSSLSFAEITRIFKGQAAEEHIKLLDTSVIIDGRIADVCEAGFIEGTFIVPQFILQELQYIADSTDSLKRARGRRGLDILHKIQKMSNVVVKIVEEDFPKIKEVDAKLVALAKMLSAKIITNDFNLNKVAALQGVSVLNINELANALKPVVLPGESMGVFVTKEGKEINQGVAYLDDGTMVVIENARRLIGKNVDVTVTSVLQTTAGRMIFAKLKEDYEKEEYRVVRG